MSLLSLLAHIEFPSKVRQILPDFSNITSDESPNDPPPFNGIYYVNDLHTEAPRLITLYDNHKSIANLHNRLQEFTMEDEVKLKVLPQRFSLGTWKKLQNQHTCPYRVLRRIGSSAYKLSKSKCLELTSSSMLRT